MEAVAVDAEPVDVEPDAIPVDVHAVGPGTVKVVGVVEVQDAPAST